MNMQKVSTLNDAITRAAGDAALLDALRNLEGPIEELQRMAKITGGLLAYVKFSKDPRGQRVLELTGEEAENVIFAINNVEDRAVALSDLFQAAFVTKAVA